MLWALVGIPLPARGTPLVAQKETICTLACFSCLPFISSGNAQKLDGVAKSAIFRMLRHALCLKGNVAQHADADDCDLSKFHNHLSCLL